MAGEVQRECLAHPFKTAFGRIVERAVGVAHLTHLRAHLDERSLHALRDHSASAGLGDKNAVRNFRSRTPS